MAQLDIREQINQYMTDFETYARECIKIKDHNTMSISPLILNRGQKILHNVAEKMKREKGYIRILLLKSRRFGGSTYVEGRFYWKTSLNFNRHTFIVGHESDSTTTLYRMAQLMHEKNPIAPSTKASNAQELIFDRPKGDGLKSQYRLATAGNVDAGRSQGVHYLHGSEEAFWPDAETLMLGLLQCVPDPPAETEIFRESTANGFGNKFQADVFAAYCEGKHIYYEEGGIPYAWMNPESDWILVFIPWFISERYTREFDNEDQKESFIRKVNQQVFDSESMKWVDSEAKTLKEKYKLTYEQLHWRDWAIMNKCGGSVDKLHQEYPASVPEAFLSKGSNVFSKVLCDDLEQFCTPPILTGELVERLGTIRVKPTTHGQFSVWKYPDKDETYFITVDSAGGKRQNKVEEKKVKKDPDPSCIDVWNARTGWQVAQWHGHVDYDMIADLVEMIGHYYGRKEKGEMILPMACVELQNHGYTVVADLSRKKYPQYENSPGEPGWQTNKRTKPQMIDGLNKGARDGSIHIVCKETISEMRTFIKDGVKLEAAPGCHDERVITAAMAERMFSLNPAMTRKSRTKSEGVSFSNWKNRNTERDTGNSYVEVRVA